MVHNTSPAYELQLTVWVMAKWVIKGSLLVVELLCAATAVVLMEIEGRFHLNTAILWWYVCNSCSLQLYTLLEL